MRIYSMAIPGVDPDACLSLFNGDERNRAGELSGRPRLQFLASRALQRGILGPDAEILRDEKGRPYVRGNPVFFSVSHSGDLVVMAVAPNPIGIDVEYMKPHDFARLSAWFFGEAIQGREDFYRRWTRFEAGLKLAGLPLFSTLAPEPLHLHSEEMGGYMLSVASNSGIRLPLSLEAVWPGGTGCTKRLGPGTE